MVSFAHPLLLQQAALAAAQEAKKRTRQQSKLTGLSTNPVLSARGPEPLFSRPRRPYTGLVAEISGDPQLSTADKVQIGLDGVALATAPVPVLNDVTGVAADGFALVRDPSLENSLYFGATLAPGLPSAGAAARALKTRYGRRGTKQGFREETFLHGTNKDVEEFDPSKSGSATGTADLNAKMLQRPVAFLSLDPVDASEHAKEVARRASSAGENVVPVRVRPERSIKMNGKGKFLDPRELRANLDVAIEAAIRRQGSPPDMIFIKNVKLSPQGKPTTMAVVFDPAKIRSVFAKFDPRRASSSDILAGLAGAGLLVSTSSQSDRQP